MKPVPNRADKLSYLLSRQAHLCAIGIMGKDMYETNLPVTRFNMNNFNNKCNVFTHRADCVMHHRMPDTDDNVKKYPLFIHSLLNVAVVNFDVHHNHRGVIKINDYKASRYEKFLSNPVHEKCNRFVNKLK